MFCNTVVCFFDSLSLSLSVCLESKAGRVELLTGSRVEVWKGWRVEGLNG